MLNYVKNKKIKKYIYTQEKKKNKGHITLGNTKCYFPEDGRACYVQYVRSA